MRQEDGGVRFRFGITICYLDAEDAAVIARALQQQPRELAHVRDLHTSRHSHPYVMRMHEASPSLWLEPHCLSPFLRVVPPGSYSKETHHVGYLIFERARLPIRRQLHA